MSVFGKEIEKDITDNPYLDFYNLLAGGTSGMLATTIAEYNSQKRQLFQLSQDKEFIEVQIAKRKKYVSDLQKKIHSIKPQMELINAF